MHNATTKSELKKDGRNCQKSLQPFRFTFFLLKSNPNIFNCFRKMSELMPNLGLEMLSMAAWGPGKGGAQVPWINLTGLISSAAQWHLHPRLQTVPAVIKIPAEDRLHPSASFSEVMQSNAERLQAPLRSSKSSRIRRAKRSDGKQHVHFMAWLELGVG